MVGASDNDRLVWIDCEMTGLDLDVDELVEIAVVVTDFELRLARPRILSRHQARRLGARAHERLRHRDAREVRAARRDPARRQSSPRPSSRRSSTSSGSCRCEGKAPLAGNTIGTDRMFLAKYMPRIDRWLHYRNVDVSSIKELCTALVPAGVHPRAREGRRPSRAGRHPRIDPRTRVLPPGRLRPRARPDERRSTAAAAAAVSSFVARSVRESSGCPRVRETWWV